MKLNYSTMRFASKADAVSALEDAGFAVGRNQASSPRGLMFGNYDVMKWRNLSQNDRDALHGRITPSGTFGAWAAIISHDCPAKGKSAFDRIMPQTNSNEGE